MRTKRGLQVLRLVKTLQGQMELIHHIRIYVCPCFSAAGGWSQNCLTLCCPNTQAYFQRNRVSRKFLPHMIKISFELLNLADSSREGAG